MSQEEDVLELEKAFANRVRELMRRGFSKEWISLMEEGFVNVTGLLTYPDGNFAFGEHGRIMPYPDFRARYGYKHGRTVTYLHDGTVWLRLDGKGGDTNGTIIVPCTNGENIPSWMLWERLRDPNWSGENIESKGLSYRVYPCNGEEIKLHPDFIAHCAKNQAQVETVVVAKH